MTYLHETYSSTTQDQDGYTNDVDCDDQDPNTYPDAPELCDEKDNDCDAVSDEDPIDATLWYLDQDNDGYGDPSTEITVCEGDDGYISQDGDCDDTHDETFPEAAENEGTACMRDEDKDGYGDDQPASSAVTPGTDCNDGDDAIHPGAPESTYDQIDSDCDGSNNY